MDNQNNIRKSPAGRKTIMTSETISKLRTAFMMGCTDEEACVFAQISHATFYREKERNPKFCEDVYAWKKNPYLKAKATIYKNLDNPKIAKWWLERKLKDEFSIKQEIALSSDSDKPLFYLPDNERNKPTE